MTEILQLERFFVTRLEIRLPSPLPDKASRKGEASFGFDLGVKQDDPCRFRLLFQITVAPPFKDGNPTLPAVVAEIQGFFKTPEKVPQDQRGSMVAVGGGAILYGALRGHLAACTGPFPTGSVNLPTVDMADIIRRCEQARPQDKMGTVLEEDASRIGSKERKGKPRKKKAAPQTI